MTFASLFSKLSSHELLNYLVSNHIPRRAATTLAGRIARIEQPLVRDLSIGIFRACCSPDLGEARKQTFSSLRDCFIRELAEGARPIDLSDDVVVSPCDGIPVAQGHIDDGMLIQAKGSSYPLAELLRSPELAAAYTSGVYVTLRLTAGMYHRFHAPHDARLRTVSHIAGDAWNVNPPTLARIPKLYCRNERAVLELELDRGPRLTLVPVAAVLVAGIKLHGVDLPGDRRHPGPWSQACDIRVRKGEEMGWFEHGSTIIVLAPPGFTVWPSVEYGQAIRYGQPLLRCP